MNKYILNDLTILLRVKDRHEYVIRWLNNIVKEKIKCKIFLLDGGLKKINLNKILKQFKEYENLINYKFFGTDINYNCYTKKNYLGICLVKTKYLILADDDDFFKKKGIIKSINFLNENEDFVAARGLIRNFKLKNPKDINSKVVLQKKALSINYNQSNAKKRIDHLFKGEFDEIFYEVHRTKHLKKPFRHFYKYINKYPKIDQNYRYIEWYIAIYTLNVGKVARFDNVEYLFRQEPYIASISYGKNRIINDIYNKKWAELIEDLMSFSIKITKKNTNLSHKYLQTYFTINLRTIFNKFIFNDILYYQPLKQFSRIQKNIFRNYSYQNETTKNLYNLIKKFKF